jgi:4-amino-4-deoxy-L-arabinose transferase-like glycosyltransferase
MWAVCLSALFVMTITLAFMPIRYTENTILLLLPLAILGAAKLDELRRGTAAFLNWFGIMTFGLLAIFIWLGFAAMNVGWPVKLAQRAAYFSPYYLPDWDVFPMIIAVCFSPLWLWAVTRKRIKGRQAITNWAAGVTLVWSLLMTLFLPWLDAAKSYRPVVEQMQKSLPDGVVEALATGKACLSVDENASNIIIPWQTYGHLPLNLDAKQSCQYRLVVGLDTMNAWQEKGNWQLLWQGARAREKKEWFAVFKQTE